MTTSTAGGSSTSGGLNSTGGSSGGASTAGGSSGGASSGGAGSSTGGAGGTSSSGGASSTGACSSSAYFCSGFEDAALPTGATYVSSNDNNDWTKGTALDMTLFHAGKQSIEFLKIAAYSQRQILVPAAKTFWFRLYMRTDVTVNGPEHNAFIAPIWAGEDKGIEICEEDCQVAVNINDTRYGSNGLKNQPGCPTAEPKGTVLAANTWYCIEGYVDGTKGDLKVFVDSKEVISLAAIPEVQKTFNGLRFGYRGYHDHQRNVWYDDVVTAPDRINCQ
jgi:hypothetical protein